MTVYLYDRAGMTTATSGTGTLTLGAALGATAPNLCTYQTFAAAGAVDQQTVSYLILDSNGAWEYGRGLYTSSGTTLARTVIASSNAGSAINLSGTAQVFISPLVEDLATNQPGGLINKLRNGTMDIWQRGTASITVTTAGAYTADGWIVVPTGASCTVAQASGRTSGLTANSLKITGATSVTDGLIKQRIESSIAAALAGLTVTVQAQIFNNTGGSITPTLTVKHAGSADNWSSPTTDVNAVSLQACANSAWTLVAYTFAASSSSGNGLEVTIDFGNNLSAGTKSVQITECDLRATPNLATGLNAYPPPAELRPIWSELAYCQRYFFSTYGNGVAATGTATRLGLVSAPTGGGAATASGSAILFPVAMRAAPTLSQWDGAGNSAKGSYFQVNAWTDNNAYTTLGLAIGTTGFVTYPGVVYPPDPALFHYTASSEL